MPLHSNQEYQLQPPAVTRMTYLSIFLENVHPLTKIVHERSVKQLVKDSLADSSSASITNTENALLLSIYSCAVSTLTDGECQSVFGVSQPGLLGAFQDATRHALLEASFLRVPDLDLLRAHILLLASQFSPLFARCECHSNLRRHPCSTTLITMPRGYSWGLLYGWLNPKVYIAMVLNSVYRLLKSRCAVDSGGTLSLWTRD